MHVIASFTLVPVDAGISLSPYVAACERCLRESGLSHQMHANGTNLEGDWQAVCEAIRACHQAVHAMGAKRVFSTVNLGTRTDREQRMAEKLDSVRRQLGE